MRNYCDHVGVKCRIVDATFTFVKVVNKFVELLFRVLRRRKSLSNTAFILVTKQHRITKLAKSNALLKSFIIPKFLSRIMLKKLFLSIFFSTKTKITGRSEKKRDEIKRHIVIHGFLTRCTWGYDATKHWVGDAVSNLYTLYVVHCAPWQFFQLRKIFFRCDSCRCEKILSIWLK